MDKKLSAVIRNAYSDLARVCESSSSADRLLHEATKAALAGEKTHRRIAQRNGRGADLAAQYFAVKWVLFPVPTPKSWLDTDVRDDARLGSTLCALLRRDKAIELAQWVYRHHSAIGAVDYARDLV